MVDLNIALDILPNLSHSSCNSYQGDILRPTAENVLSHLNYNAYYNVYLIYLTGGTDTI